MQIQNRSKKTEICTRVEQCNSFWEQTRGMMLRKRVVPLLFTFSKEQIVRLHSWFCPGAMDLILINDEWKVVEVYAEWQTCSAFVSEKRAMFLLELPKETIAKSKTAVGDVVQIMR